MTLQNNITRHEITSQQYITTLYRYKQNYSITNQYNKIQNTTL